MRLNYADDIFRSDHGSISIFQLGLLLATTFKTCEDMHAQQRAHMSSGGIDSVTKLQVKPCLGMITE
jgi:hypothetical protein